MEGKEDELSKKALERLELYETLGDLPYEALLIADGGDRLLQVAALLPFYDIDPQKIQILGTGQWDVAGIGAEPALLGAWFAAPPRRHGRNSSAAMNRFMASHHIDWPRWLMMPPLWRRCLPVAETRTLTRRNP